ncbi:hypothetical protein D3C77_368760 [compost metagenome]
MRNKHFAENFFSVGPYFIQVFSDLDAAGFPAASRVNLGFYYNYLAAQRFRCFHGFIHRKGNLSFWNGYTVLLQDFFSLIFMDIHS